MKNKFVAWMAFASLLMSAIALAGCYSAQAAPQSDHQAPMSSADHAVPVAAEPHQVYDAATSPASATKELNLTLEEKNIEIAPGVTYQAWTFNGTVPGPVLRVHQGDQVRVTITNNSKMQHSLDFHAAQTPPNVNYKNLNPGETYSYTFTANYPGVFMYHCGTAPALAHIASGMYGAIIVDPAETLPPAKEYVLVQSEFYTKDAGNGLLQYDGAKALAVQPDYVVFNGYANQYKDHPLTANPGERLRIWVLNAGPSEFSAFHVVGAIFDKAFPDGDPKNVEYGRQTVTVPPGGSYMVELTIPDAGLYPFVTHSFADPGKGALGVLNLGNVQNDPGMSH